VEWESNRKGCGGGAGPPAQRREGVAQDKRAAVRNFGFRLSRVLHAAALGRIRRELMPLVLGQPVAAGFQFGLVYLWCDVL
jgi:hypothetical protein